MAILAQLGANLEEGAVVSVLTIPNATNYYVQRVTEGGKDVDFEDTFNADGLRVTRSIFNKNRRVSVEMVCKSGATPLSDFPVGTLVATDWYVESAPVEKTKSPWTVTVDLVEIFVST